MYAEMPGNTNYLVWGSLIAKTITPQNIPGAHTHIMNMFYASTHTNTAPTHLQQSLGTAQQSLGMAQ